MLLIGYHDLLSILQADFWAHVVLMALGGYGTWNSSKKFYIRKVTANLSIVSPFRQMVQYVLQAGSMLLDECGTYVLDGASCSWKVISNHCMG
jgi:hypothetical protein